MQKKTGAKKEQKKELSGTSEKCSLQCERCRRVGCCGSCAHRDTLEFSQQTVTFWCNFDFARNKLTVAKRKFNVGEHMIPNGGACAEWSPRYTQVNVTGARLYG